ncbi:MAG TPA: carboxypeptidase regulatory-like domain-containing protein, partial [Candidatus Tumulicola sp.]
MNRTGKSLASALVVGFFLTIAPAGAQVALVVGSVRDQHGSPIEGAAIVAFGARGSATAAATTDAVGTFSLRGDGIRSVAISCRYCRSQTVAVVPGEPVIGIVRRFDALFYDSPSPQDLANLPYAHVESA